MDLEKHIAFLEEKASEQLKEMRAIENGHRIPGSYKSVMNMYKEYRKTIGLLLRMKSYKTGE